MRLYNLSDTLLNRLSPSLIRKNLGFGWTNFKRTTLEPRDPPSWPIDLSFGMLPRIRMRQYKIGKLESAKPIVSVNMEKLPTLCVVLNLFLVFVQPNTQRATQDLPQTEKYDESLG